MSRSSRVSSNLAKQRQLTRAGRKSIEELLQKLEGSGELPSLPQIIVKLNAVAHDSKSSASDLANIILRDQSLTSRILQISNSALYGSHNDHGIGTVTQAVIVLGFTNVVRLAMGITVFNTLDTVAHDHHLLRIWMHSIACAVAAEGIAQSARVQGTEEAFVAGLLHDVGKLILLRHAPEQYRRILDRVEKGEDQLEVEREELGHTHADVGQAVARSWNLPNSLVNVLANHDRFGEKGNNLQNVVALANHIAKVYYAVVQKASALRLTDLEKLARTRLGLPPEKLAGVLNSLRSNVEECLEIFGLQEARESKRVADLGGEPSGEEHLQAIFVQMESDIHRKSAQLSLLQQVSHTLVHESDPDVVFPTILEGLYVGLQLERVALVLPDGSGGREKRAFGPDVEDVLPLLDMDENKGHPLSTVLETGRPLSVLDRSMPAYGELVCAWEWPAPCFAAVPVSGASGVVGLLIGDRGAIPLTDDDLEMMALFANQIALALVKTGRRT
jgi:putative nucleotidyltransferase with HDIG domain